MDLFNWIFSLANTDGGLTSGLKTTIMVLDNLDVLCLVGSVTTAIEFAYTLAVPNTVIIRSPQLPQLVVTFAPDWAEQFASFMCHTFHATLSSRPWRMSLYGVRIGTAAMIAFISSINSVSGDGISETPAWYSFILLALRFVFAVLVSIESFFTIFNNWASWHVSLRLLELGGHGAMWLHSRSNVASCRCALLLLRGPRQDHDRRFTTLVSG